MGLTERFLSNSIAELSSTRGSTISKLKKRRFVHLDATCRFDQNIFCEQFLCHLLFPLSIVYLRYKYGKTAPYNQVFSNFGVRAFFWQFITHLYWLLIVVYFWKRNELNEAGITDEEFVSTIMAGIIFRGMVASKYASLSREEYKMYLLNEDDQEIVDFRVQLQLISGWLDIDIERMAHESELAFTRLGMYRDECNIPVFCISSQEAPKWVGLLGEHSHVLKRNEEGGGQLYIEATDLMSVAFSISKNNQLKTIGQVLGLITSILLGALPNIVRANCGILASLTWASKSHRSDLCVSTSFFGNGWLAHVYSFCLMLQGIVMAVPLNMFLITLILSSIRLYKCCELYGYLIRNDKRAYDNYPVLDLKNPDNIRAWVRSFQGLYQVGARYAQRMDWYSKFIFGLLVFLLLWVFLTFTMTSAAYGYDDDNDKANVNDDTQIDDDDWNAPNLMFVNVEFWIVLFLLIVWGFAFAINLAIIAANNKAVLRQELELLQRRLCLREHLNKMRGIVSKYSEAGGGDSTTSPLTSPLLSPPPSTSNKKEEMQSFSVSSNRQSTNNTRTVHTASSSVLQYRYQKSTDSLEEVEGNFDELDDLLDTAVKVIEGQMRVQPHRFLGANGTWGLVIQFFVVWVTVIGAVLGIAGIKTET